MSGVWAARMGRLGGACCRTTADREPFAGLRAWNEIVVRSPGANLHRCSTLPAVECRQVFSVSCSICAPLRQRLAVHAEPRVSSR